MHAITVTTTLLMLQRDFRRRPSVAESSSPFFGASLSVFVKKYYPTTDVLLMRSARHACVCAVCWVSHVEHFLIVSPIALVLVREEAFFL